VFALSATRAKTSNFPTSEFYHGASTGDPPRAGRSRQCHACGCGPTQVRFSTQLSTEEIVRMSETGFSAVRKLPDRPNPNGGRRPDCDKQDAAGEERHVARVGRNGSRAPCARSDLIGRHVVQSRTPIFAALTTARWAPDWDDTSRLEPNEAPQSVSLLTTRPPTAPTFRAARLRSPDFAP
jgi:hypothetical protein